MCAATSSSKSTKSFTMGHFKDYLSPRDLAGAIGVSESSLKRWADEGRIAALRTAGGHRRIALHEAIRFVRSSQVPLVRPDLLGFPDLPEAASGLEPDAGLDDRFHAALVRDDPKSARALLVWAYLGGTSIASLCDGPIRAALHHIGDLWRHDPAGIMVEHRAVDCCLQILNLLRGTLPPAAAEAPVALGASPAGDPYLLPSLMAATTLGEVGFRDINLGPNTPTATLRTAIERYAPRLVWVGCSTVEGQPAVWGELVELADDLAPRGIHVALGGRGLPAKSFPRRPNLVFPASMSELAGYARGLGVLVSKF